MRPLLQTAVLACLALSCSVDAANILALFPMHSRSHWGLGQTFLKALHARGHSITVVTSFQTQDPPHNWREVVVPDTTNTFRSGTKINMFELSMNSPFLLFFFLSNFALGTCEILLGDEGIQQLYKSSEKFDAVISEDFNQECLDVFAHRFGAPLVLVAPYDGPQWVGDRMGNPAEMAYYPDALLSYSDHMDFFQRLHNAVHGTLGRLLRHWYLFPAMDAIVQKKLNDSSIPSIAALEERTSLLLMNTHMSISYPRPLTPNMVMVGGWHVKPPKPLPEDLQKYLDKAKDGVIYFSMGSNLKSAEMPEEKRAAFLAAFSKLKEKVLWKWEDDNLPNKPANVMVGKWLPQSDILAHKNVKVFITHGGMHSTLEALHHGVPLLAIPIFGDQSLNSNRARDLGYAVKLDFANVTKDSLHWALTEVLENPRYKEQAKVLSERFRDRPRPPMEEAIYWTEYVIRHRGATHMRSAALDLAWYQYLLLDVVAAVLLALAAVTAVVVFLVRTVVRLMSGKSSKVKSGGKRKGAKKD